MAIAQTGPEASAAQPAEWGTARRRWIEIGRYLRRNPSLGIGLFMLLLLLVFSLGGQLIIDPRQANPLSAIPSQPPSWEYPFGTDTQGRNLLAVLIMGTYLTVRVGIIAGTFGIAFGGFLGFVAAYYGGFIDAAINYVVDVLLTVPALLILVVIAATIKGQLTADGMALIVALLAWRRPTRQIRAQVLSMRESGYVLTARLAGLGGLEIIFKELMPNLLPYIGASFVMAVAAAILASVGLEAMGLGPQNDPTLGMTVYWMMYYSAFLRGMWWWILAPITVLIILFVGLYLINAGLDELANPRLRRKAAT